MWNNQCDHHQTKGSCTIATLTADMKTFIENNLAWITTVDKYGNLDLGPKMSMFVLDDNHLAYHERTAGQHYRDRKSVV